MAAKSDLYIIVVDGPLTVRRIALVFGCAIAVPWALFPRQFTTLWDLWTQDGLRSIGLLMPAAAAVLSFRAWRATPPARLAGTHTGLLLICVATFVAALVPRMPFGCILTATVAGVVLQLAGYEALLAARLPLCLLLFVNPVPGVFGAVADLPLQHVSARLAYSTAHLIGVPLSINNLDLILPDGGGMWIAAGCNGLRSAVTLGYLVAILGCAKRYNFGRLALTTIAGTLLGYIVNLCRLFVLVIYNWAIFRFGMSSALEPVVDRVIGGLLFFMAAGALVFAILALPPQISAYSRAHSLPLEARH